MKFTNGRWHAMQKKLISLAVQGLLNSGDFPVPVVDYGQYRKPLWHERNAICVTCDEGELRQGIDYEYEVSTGTIRFLRPINGTVNVTSPYSQAGRKRRG